MVSPDFTVLRVLIPSWPGWLQGSSVQCGIDHHFHVVSQGTKQVPTASLMRFVFVDSEGWKRFSER